MEKQTILIVDDERDLCDMFALYFTLEGFDVKIASDGTQAMIIIREGIPDIVICDIRMPNCDGFCLMEEINKIRNPPPVIILSGSLETGEDLTRLAKYSNFAEYFSKPVAIKQLVRSIKDRLKKCNHSVEL